MSKFLGEWLFVTVGTFPELSVAVGSAQATDAYF